MKRVAIIDDRPEFVENMGSIASAAGHEVLAVSIFDEPYCMDLEKVARVVGGWKPDIVFIDHDLQLGQKTGEDLARILALPKKMLIGTSLYNQTYCQRHFDGKGRISSDQAVSREFLEIIEE